MRLLHEGVAGVRGTAQALRLLNHGATRGQTPLMRACAVGCAQTRPDPLGVSLSRHTRVQTLAAT